MNSIYSKDEILNYFHIDPVHTICYKIAIVVSNYVRDCRETTNSKAFTQWIQLILIVDSPI